MSKPKGSLQLLYVTSWGFVAFSEKRGGKDKEGCMGAGRRGGGAW